MSNKVTAHTYVLDARYIANDQFTIPQKPEGGYDGILTAEGEQALNRCLELVQTGFFKDTFVSWSWDHTPSGGWFSETGYDPVIQARGFFNTRNNIVVVGKLRSQPDKDIQTSQVRFSGEGWVYTLSGSLYAVPAEAYSHPGNKEVFWVPIKVGDLW